MARRLALQELLVGIEGLALLRHLHEGTDEAARRRLGEIRALLDDGDLAAGEPATEADATDGYRAWSESYDDAGNQIVDLEQPVVWEILADIPSGRALDAACGTGRHTRRLLELGHEVLGIDVTPEMLSRAAAELPGARFVQADLLDLPVPDREFDLVVCGLALAHLRRLDTAVTGLARVLRPGGRMIISVLHPLQAMLGWQASFRDEHGRHRFVREYAHSHADYFAAFRSARLRVRGCVEPRFGAEHARAKRRAFERIPEATTAAYAGLPGVLVWDLERA